MDLLEILLSEFIHKMVSIPLPTFDTPFSSPLEEKLTSDGKSATGKITILPGVKVDGVAGGTTTIGGISSTVKVNKLEDGCIICFSERSLKADFHSVQNVARSTFSERFLLNYKQSSGTNLISCG